MTQNKKDLAKVALTALLLSASLPATSNASDSESSGTVLAAGCASSSKGCGASAGCGAYNNGAYNPQYSTNPRNVPPSNPNYPTYETPGTTYYQPGQSYDPQGTSGQNYRPMYDSGNPGTNPYTESYPAAPRGTYNPNNPRPGTYDSTPRR